MALSEFRITGKRVARNQLYEAAADAVEDTIFDGVSESEQRRLSAEVAYVAAKIRRLKSPEKVVPEPPPEVTYP